MRGVDPRWIGVILVVVAVGLDLAWPLPADWLKPEEARRVLDRRGGVLAERVVPTRGHDRWVELDEVAPVVLDALRMAEDRRFDWHPGVDPLALLRATRANLRAGRAVQGGSTLTQQTARLLADRPAGLWGKVVEARWALRLDLHLTKDEILTWYLNRAYFGRGAWGIEAAARAWFDEGAGSVSVAEAVALVALLPGPDRLSPEADPEGNRARRFALLDRMVQAGHLTAEAAERAKREPLQIRRRPREGRAPHLAARLLAADRARAQLPSTLDPVLQDRVVAVVSDVLGELGGREVDHAAVLVVDVQTDEVLAYVGSGDFSAPDGQNDGVRARRSTGSALKPFLYGLAFEQGWTPADVLRDLPRRWTTPRGSWAPRNYGEAFHGPVRARVALASSFNLPAVQILEEVGVSTALHRLHLAGIELPKRPAHYGLGLAIGGAEGTLEELVALYAAMARGGRARPLRMLQDDPVGEETPVLDPLAAWMVTDVLADPVARVPAFGRHGPLARAYPAAVKTGTSAGFRDNWAVGYTPRHAVGVWVGNFDGRAMGDVSGVTGAGPLWARVMDAVTGREAAAFPPPPEGTEVRRYCALSGEPVGPQCPDTVDEVVPRDHPHGGPCTWHLAGCEVAWPSAYRGWAAEQGLLGAGEGCPTEGEVAIAWPGDGAVLYIDPTLPLVTQRVALRPSAPAGAVHARWTVDGLPVQTPGNRPLEVLWTPPRAGRFEIRLEVDGVQAPPVGVEVRGVRPAGVGSDAPPG